MICPGCATPLKDGARFCHSCGTPLGAPTCAACSAELVRGSRFCSECGTPQGGAAPATVVGAPVASRRVTSVLFGDLVGFTTLAEQRDHEETREILGRYFEECRRVIQRYGGTVEKFIGDAVMAVWGVPAAHEDDAERAVRAGLELVNQVGVLGEKLGVPGLAMRVGIVTGEVAVTIGAEQQGMVAGDAVNTAARVQSVAPPGQVWVDETTRLLTSSAISYADVGSHELKGKAEPVPLWSVRAVVAGVGGVQRADGLEAPLIGRDRELRLVKELFHAVDDSGKPALLVLVGEPGVGKSRLVWEFDKYVDGLTRTTRWHTGRCVAYGEGVAYYALAEALRARLRGLAPDDDAEDGPEPAALLDLGLDRFVPDADERAWIGPRLGALLGIGSVGTYPREDLFSAWTVFLQRVGEGAYPVVLVIDDAHHSDEGLLQFVEHLLAAATFPCFVVLLARPALLEQHPELAANRRATVTHLHALEDADVAQLMDALVVGLPEQVRDSLVARAEGVPLFAVETVRSLIDRDLVIPRGGQYVLADPAALDLDSIGAPASLQALIAARLDALDAQQRRVVERASVIGDVFSRSELEQLCADVDDLDGVLAGLVRQQLFSQLNNRFSADFGDYQFVQSVVRQVAYGTLSRRDRRALHLAVARLVEAEDTESGELAPIIAQHYIDAVEAVPEEPDVPELVSRAIAELERAAARARALGALSESAGHLLLALERAKDPATVARLHKNAAGALFDAGEYDQAIAHATSAVEAYDAQGDPVQAATAAAVHADALISLGDNARAVEVVEPRWEAVQEVAGAEAAMLTVVKSLIAARGRQNADVRVLMDRRIQLAELLGDPEEVAASLTSLSVNFSFLGARQTGLVLMNAAADIARTHHLPAALAGCLNNLTVEYAMEDLERAVETAREGVEQAGRSGRAIWMDYTQANLMLALLAAGRWEELEVQLAQPHSGSVISQAIGAGVRGLLADALGRPYSPPWSPGPPPETDDPADGAWISVARAVEERTAGRTVEALEHAVHSVDALYRQSLVSDDFVHPWPLALDLAVESGDAHATHHLLDRVDEAGRQMRIPPGVAAHRDRGKALTLRSTDPEQAVELLRGAVSGFEAWGARAWRARAEGELGLLLRDLGHEDEAAPLLRGAVAVLTELGALGWLAEFGSEAPSPTTVAVPSGS